MNLQDWGEEEFGRAGLGDARRHRRLIQMAVRVAEAPAGTVSAVFRTTAEREGAYRLLSNEHVDWLDIAEASHAACVERCRGERVVFVAEDGSSLNITDDTRAKGTGPIGARGMGARGFQLMNAIAITLDGVPVGICGQTWWARSEKADPRSDKAKSPEEKETRHWYELAAQVRERFATYGDGDTIAWFQYDRGGDAWPVLLDAQNIGQWVTVRSSSDRRIADSPDGTRRYLRETVAASPVLGSYNLRVTGGPGRAARTAVMEVKACPVALQMTDDRTSKKHEVVVWAVSTKEVGSTPEGEKPLHWLLLTTRPVLDLQDAQLTIYGYTQRWRVEEFHKAWKSAYCDVEDLQLRSENGIRAWGTLLAAAAMRLLRLTYLSRHEPDRPATDEFSVDEIHAVHMARDKDWNGKRIPTIGQVTRWIADLGGYVGKSSGGPPGMIVLARGWERVAPIARVVSRLRRLQGGGSEM
ncbi:MAG: IS4 family transposase [Caulobacter sp.]|nr:IS4 family transposase [Caulobacter sp.]